MLHAHRDRQVAGRHCRQRAGEVGEVVLRLRHRDRLAHRKDELPHRRIHRRAITRAAIAERQQRIPRRALALAGAQRNGIVRRAALDHTLAVEERGTHRHAHRREIEVAGADLHALVLVVQIADIPVPAAAAQFEVARQRATKAVGTQRQPVLARHLPTAPGEVHLGGIRITALVADRVVVAVDRHRCVERLRRIRIARIARERRTIGVQHVAGEAETVAQRVIDVDEHRLAFDARQQRGLLDRQREIRRIQRAEAVQVTRIETGRLAPQGEVAAPGNDQPAVLGGRALTARPRRPALAHREAVRREPAVDRPHRVLFRVLRTHRHRATIRAEACDQVDHGALAIALRVLAAVDARLHAIEVAPGDQVDDAGDRIRAVQRRRAVLQYLDALDHCRRYLRNVLQAAGGNAQPLAVDQHQRAVGAEVAQVDVRAAHRLTRGQGRRAADRRAAGAGDVLQDIGDRIEALLLDVLARDHQDRRRSLHVDLADARSGDFDAVQRGGWRAFRR